MRLLLATCAVLLVALPASAANPLANPDFDTDVSSWFTSPDVAMTWNFLDVSSSPSSGSAQQVNTLAGTGAAPGAVSECLQVTGGLEYEASGWAYIPSGQANTGRPFLAFTYYANSDCTSPLVMVQNSDAIPADQWTKATDDSVLPPEARSARVHIGSVKDQEGGSLVLLWDAIDFQPVPQGVPTLSGPGVVALALLLLAVVGAVARRASKSRGT